MIDFTDGLNTEISLKWNRILWSCCFAVVGLTSLLFHLKPWRETLDFPLQMTSVQLLLSGETPFVDFHTVYGPIRYYLVGWFTQIWPGEGLAEEAKIFFFLTSLIMLGLFALIFRLLAGRNLLANSAGCFSLLLFGPILMKMSHYSSLPVICVLASLIAVYYLFETGISFKIRAGAAAAMGFLAVFAAFTMFNFGAYLAIAGVGIFVSGLIAKRAEMLKLLGIYLASLALVSGLFALLLLPSGQFLAFSRELGLTIERYYKRHSPPFDYLPTLRKRAEFLLIVGLAVFQVIMAAYFFFKRRHLLMQYIGALVIAFFQYSYFRYGVFHYYPLFMFLMFGFMYLFKTSISEKFSYQKTAAVVFMGMLLLIPVLDSPTALRQYRSLGWRLLSGEIGSAPEPFTEIDGLLFYPEEMELIQILREENEDWLLMTMPGTCECFRDYCANLSLYLAAGLNPAGYYFFFDPTTTAVPAVQEKIVADVERLGPTYILVEDDYADIPSTPGTEPEPSILYDYVSANYELLLTRTRKNKFRFHLYQKTEREEKE